MTNNELKLLIDLCRQIDKHGIDTFINLVGKIKNADTISSLELLIPVVKKRHATTATSTTYDKQAIEIIEKEQKKQSKHNEKLMSVYVHLKHNSSASAVKKIKYFLETNGKTSAGLNGKEKSIAYLIGELSKSEKLLIEASHFFNDSDDRALSAWSDVIMNNKFPSDKN